MEEIACQMKAVSLFASLPNLLPSLSGRTLSRSLANNIKLNASPEDNQQVLTVISKGVTSMIRGNHWKNPRLVEIPRYFLF